MPKCGGLSCNKKEQKVIEEGGGKICFHSIFMFLFA
jgi:hypothetical protein